MVLEGGTICHTAPPSLRHEGLGWTESVYFLLMKKSLVISKAQKWHSSFFFFPHQHKTTRQTNKTANKAVANKSPEEAQFQYISTMEQLMTPNVSRDDSEDDHLCRSIQLLRRGRPVVQGECHLPDLRSSSNDEDIQRFMDISHSKQDEYCSTPRREASDDHIHRLPWGRLVTDRNKVPDLMSEDVDEEIEQFMILPLKETSESSPSRHKRRHDNNQEHSSYLDGGLSYKQTAY